MRYLVIGSETNFIESSVRIAPLSNAEIDTYGHVTLTDRFTGGVETVVATDKAAFSNNSTSAHSPLNRIICLAV